jgi:hypothetical protein
MIIYVIVYIYIHNITYITTYDYPGVFHSHLYLELVLDLVFIISGCIE